MIKTLFFDVDGTLYDETHAKIKAELGIVQILSKQLNKPFMEIYNTYLNAKHRILKSSKSDPNRNNRVKWYESTLRDLGVQGINPEFLGDKYWEIIKKSIEPYYDFTCVLPELSKKYDLYVITDELLEIQKQKLKQLGLLDSFKDIISSTHVGAVKPEPELFRYALGVAHCTPNEALMIGDNPSRDIKGGNSIGMGTVWLQRGKYHYYPQEATEKPTITIKNFTQLEQSIEELEKKRNESQKNK